MSVTEPYTGTVIKGKITLAEPNSDQRASGVISADELIETINLALKQLKITTWLVLDRLDVAFSDSPILEKNTLRALFRVYLDMLPFSNISIKIFLRDDIWQKLIDSGFREASHVTRTLTISWGKQSLLNLVVRRLIHNPDVCKFYGVIKEVLAKRTG